MEQRQANMAAENLYAANLFLWGAKRLFHRRKYRFLFKSFPRRGLEISKLAIGSWTQLEGHIDHE